jgi:hypothetical protein
MTIDAAVHTEASESEAPVNSSQSGLDANSSLPEITTFRADSSCTPYQLLRKLNRYLAGDIHITLRFNESLLEFALVDDELWVDTRITQLTEKAQSWNASGSRTVTKVYTLVEDGDDLRWVKKAEYSFDDELDENNNWVHHKFRASRTSQEETALVEKHLDSVARLLDLN